MEIFLDIETDGLFPQVTKVNLIGVLYGDDVYLGFKDCNSFRMFVNNLLDQGEKIVFIGHNIITFDSLVLKNFIDDDRLDACWDSCIDTLLLSRFLFPTLREHSLEFWGNYFNLKKLDIEEDDLEEYNKRDLEITKLLYNNQKRKLSSALNKSVNLEHSFAYAVREQIRHGFCFDVGNTNELKNKLTEEVAVLMTNIQKEMLLYCDTSLINKKNILPNPRSRQQLVSFFKTKYNWQPKEFTDKGSPKFDEEILRFLPYPEAGLMIKLFTLNSKLATVKKWFEYAKYTGKVHGDVNTLGAITGRCSHQKPNMANISTDKIMRGCWVASSQDMFLGSVDFQAQEARGLAHFLYQFDGGEFASMLANDEFDVHTLNQERMGFKFRRTAKSFLYAFTYGAHEPRLIETIAELDEISLAEAAKLVKEKLYLIKELYPNIPKLQTYYRKYYKQCRFILGLDGRVLIPQKTYSGGPIINCLIQNAGAVLMKQAMVNLYKNVPEIKIVANVHDEIVFEAPKTIAESLKEKIHENVINSGIPYNFKCKLEADVKFGENWGEVH